MKMSNDGLKKVLRVTFFGDSICVGQGVSIYRGWVTRLAEQLDSHGSIRGVRLLVTNASVNGRTTRQALEDMPYHVQSHGVDLIFIQFGLNDCNYWLSDKGNPRVSLEAFKANLREIITRAITFGARKVLLNTNHPTSRNREIIPHTAITYEQSNRSYNAAIRTVADEFEDIVVFHDMERHFESLVATGIQLETLLLDDGLHLSIRGHDHYLDYVAPKTKAALDSLVGDL